MCLWMPLPRRSSDMHWTSLLQKLFALLEPAVPTDLRGVLENMGVSAASIDELIRKCEGKPVPEGVSAVDAQFISAYTSEEPPIYKNVSTVFNDVSTRLISDTRVDDLSTENMSQTFRGQLLACAGFYIRLQQALHRLPERFWVHGTFHRGVAYKYGASLDQFEGRLISMLTPKSTSRNRDVALDFARGNNGTLFTFENAHGFDISEFSLFEREEEVVIGMFNDFTGKVHADIVDEIVLQGQSPLTLVALGVTSHGKSQSLNTLTSLGKTPLFNTRRTKMGSCTQELRVETMPWLGSGAPVRFVDTPGGADTQGKDPQNLARIQHDISQKIRHVDAFAVMIKYSPTLDNHVKCLLRQYQERFGEDFINHLVIVVTHWDYNEDLAERTREEHLGAEGVEKYEREMNASLQEVLQVNKPFNFVYLDNKCKPQKNKQDEFDLHKQLAKLWNVMTDTGERFDGHRQESVYYQVVDDECPLKCHCPVCSCADAPQNIWKVCTQRGCEHFGQTMHYDCWSFFHRGSSCAGKVLCKRTFADMHAEHLPLLLGACGATASLGCIVLEHAFESGACAAVNIAVSAVDHIPTEAMVEMLGGSDLMAHMSEFGWTRSLEVVGNSPAGLVFGGALGAAVAWYMYTSKRRKAYDQLAMHYTDPTNEAGMSPEEFAAMTVGAYRELQARVGVVGAGVAAGAWMMAHAASGGAMMALLVATCVGKLVLGEAARRWGVGQVEQAFKSSHWQIVAQSLRGLDLIDHVNKELQGDVSKLSWEKVKSQHRFLALKDHPDKVIRIADDVEGSHAQRVSEATQRFVQIQASFEILEGYHKRLPTDKWEDTLRGALSVSGEPCVDAKDLKQRLDHMEVEALQQLPARVLEDQSRAKKAALKN